MKRKQQRLRQITQHRLAREPTISLAQVYQRVDGATEFWLKGLFKVSGIV